jgi:voltage-gated potassium channel
MTPWERRAEWPLAAAALVFLAAYAWPILDPNLSTELVRLCTVVTWVVWGTFVLDYVVRIAQAADRRRWFARHLPDLVILVLPLLRPLRLLRLVTLLNVLNRSASSGLRGKVLVYVAGGSTLLAFVVALAVLDAERGAEGGNIATFEDAVWWACTTMTTVGYGDRFPVTGTGRMVGVGLMIGGIALLGAVTAALAYWLIEAVRDEADETNQEVEELRIEIRRLADLIDARL